MEQLSCIDNCWHSYTNYAVDNGLH
uniref:Uncharacterized protein n=1 Tax=Arundo donax TaxID=35708 RepID=A0A0A9B8K6_ARUDO